MSKPISELKFKDGTTYGERKARANAQQIAEALDILWCDIDDVRDPRLTLVQVASKLANVIHWRNVEIEAMKTEIKKLKQCLAACELGWV